MDIHIITSQGEDHILSVIDGEVVIIPPAATTTPSTSDAQVEPTPE